MNSLSNPNIQVLRAKCERAKALMDRDDYALALEALEEALSLAREAEVPRAWLAWARAVCLDVLHRPLEALQAIEAALVADPASPVAWNSRCVIVENVRRLLTDPDVDPLERALAFDVLARSGMATYADQVVRVRSMMDEGSRGDALVLAMMVAALWPTDEINQLVEELRPSTSETH